MVRKQMTAQAVQSRSQEMATQSLLVHIGTATIVVTQRYIDTTDHKIAGIS